MDLSTSLAQLNLDDSLKSDETKVNLIVAPNIADRLKQSGYKESITKGQRRFHLPSVEIENDLKDCQIFCGRIPARFTEDQLFPIFEQCGKVLDFQLMMNSNTDNNRGFAFITYAQAAEANACVAKLNNYKIDHGVYLNVKLSTPNRCLFVGNIPKVKSKEMIRAEFNKELSGISDVIVYSCPDDKQCLNRGFCFVVFDTHQAAARAKRRLENGRVRIWNNDMFVDWADPQDEPDENVMQMVKVLYVRNLSNEVTEEEIRQTFEPFGQVERVKKMKNYAFVHFEDRDCAIEAMNSLNGKVFNDGSPIEIILSKPPSDKKKKEEILRARERRMLKSHARRSRSSSNNNGRKVIPMPEPHRSMSIFKNVNCWPQATSGGHQHLQESQRACFTARPLFMS